MMKSFSLNPKKKQDIEKQKKLAEQEACAEVYEEFVAAFEQPSSSSQSKIFVRGSVINPNSGQDLSVQDCGKLYKPDKLEELERKKTSVDTKKKDNKHKDDNKFDNDHHSHHNQRHSSSLSSSDKPAKKKSETKKKSNLEIFKEELKMLQEEREERFKHRNNSNDDNSINKENKYSLSHNSKSCDDSSNCSSNITNSFSRKPTGGSHDTGDPNTTNIYLGNLSPKMTETQLCEIFGRYGPLASVKIMWPRSEEERIRNRNCGFVAFMSRKDAERALKVLNNRTFLDYEMRLGWGKAVTIPPTPIYVPKVLHELIMPPPQSGLPFNAQVEDEKDKELLQKYGNDPQKLYHDNPEAFNDLLSRTVVKVTIPQDRTLLCLIHRVIEFVVREGPPFEALLMNREINNPQYSFLFDNQSAAHIYYRWRLYSVLQGEHPSRWRTEDFRMFMGGSLWRPPPIYIFQQGMPDHLLPNDDFYNDGISNAFNDDKNNDDDSHYDDDRRSESSSSDSDDSYHRHRHRRRENGYSSSSKKSKSSRKNRHKESSSKSSVSFKSHKLSSKDREQLEDMLRALNPTRSKIGEMTCFCIDHSDSWEEIVDCITDSLSIPETPLYKKIARLFLISDILHNCSVKVLNVSNYRKVFQSKLPDIFQSFHQTYNQIEGRLKAEQFKQRVMSCFRAWEDSAIYSSDFLIKLQNIFLGLTSSSSAATTPSKGSNPTMLKAKELANKSLFFNKSDEIDGEPIYDDEDIDGIEMMPSTTISSVNDNSRLNEEDPFKNKFKASKWETIDPVDDMNENSTSSLTKITSKWNKVKDASINLNDNVDDFPRQNIESDKRNNDFDDEEDIDGKPIEDDDFIESIMTKNNDSKNSETPSSASTNLSRQTLREIELKVVKYQDELEQSLRMGKSVLNSYETIEQKVEKYRNDLLKKAIAIQDQSSNKRSRSRSKSPSSSSRYYTSPSSSSSSRRRR